MKAYHWSALLVRVTTLVSMQKLGGSGVMLSQETVLEFDAV